MERTISKILCVLLVVVMCLTSIPIGSLLTITQFGIVSSAADQTNIQYAIMPLKTINVTQKAGGNYSHKGTNNVDFGGKQNLYAPFDCKVVERSATYDGGNRVIVESASKIKFADDTYDYMTVLVAHDNDISDMPLGKSIKKGDVFYCTGDYGNVTGIHVHMCVAKGKYAGLTKNKYGKWQLKNSILPSNAFFIDNSTKITESGGYTWKKLPAITVDSNVNGGSGAIGSQTFKGNVVKSWNVKNIEKLSQTDAQIKARVNFNKRVKCTQAGFYFGTSKDNLKKNAKVDNINYKGTYLDMWFLMSKYGQKLKSGTTYYYKFYVVADGQTYYSSVQSFKTKEASVVKSWNVKSIEKLSKTDVQIKARVNFNKSVKCTQAGFYFGTSKDNLKKNAKVDNINYKGTYLDMWFLMSKYGQKLKSGTTYYYKFYVIADGVTYYSSVQSFKTK